MYIVGAGGHAKVVFEAAVLSGIEVQAFVVPSGSTKKTFLGRPLIVSSEISEKKISAFVAIGDNYLRNQLVLKIRSDFESVIFKSIIHPQAMVDMDVQLGEGVFVARGVIINKHAQIMAHSIVNSGAIIEHDCKIGSLVNVGPGSALGGESKISDRSILGMSSVVHHKVNIASDVVVGSLSLVTKDIKNPGIYYGAPARFIRARSFGDKVL